jgi:uncharacterized coiled-coil protein SlyX
VADASILDNKVILGGIVAAFSALSAVVVALWSRIDRMNSKCVEDRDKSNAKYAEDRDKQNQERAAENKAWFERVETLYKERGLQSREMFDQVVKLAEKSKDSEHATINALVETGRMISGINQTLTSLTGKIDDLGRDLRLLHGQTKDSPRG